MQKFITVFFFGFVVPEKPLYVWNSVLFVGVPSRNGCIRVSLLGHFIISFRQSVFYKKLHSLQVAFSIAPFFFVVNTFTKKIKKIFDKKSSATHTIKKERQMKKEKGKQSIIGGAVIIALGGFIAKVIGALYRIPLTNLIGGKGIGLYQLIYPTYCLLLTVSATGIPASISKLTAEKISKGQSPKTVLKKAMKLFCLIGLAGSVLMAISAPFLSKLQGSQEVVFGYYALAPSVFFVSAISVFRGYFQGKNKMFPTALSEVVEQVVKVGAGLFFAYKFRSNLRLAVTFLLLSVSISEITALGLMFLLYKKNKNKEEGKQGGRVEAKQIIRLSLPVTISSLLLPLSALLDSVLVVRLLSAYAENAVTLYGLFSGGAVTIINLPVSVCYGIAVSSVPAVVKAEKEGKKAVRKKWLFSLFITIAVALPSALALYLFAPTAVKVVFRSLTGEEREILIRLVKTLSISALFLSCVQTLSACLTAQGKPQKGAIAMLIAVTVKTACYTLLLKSSKISVFGLAHATNLCYFVAFLLDLLYNIRVNKRRKE